MKAPHVVFEYMSHQPSSIHSARSHSTASSFSFWEYLWKQLFTLDSQLQVTQKYDREGNEYYQIHHPLSGQTKFFISRQDAVVWLDQKRF